MLGVGVEKKRDPKIVHKYRGTAYVEYRIKVEFKDGEAHEVSYDTLKWKTKEWKRQDSDKLYPIPLWDDFRAELTKHPNMLLVVYRIANEAFCGDAAYAEDRSSGKIKRDFTNYDEVL